MSQFCCFETLSFWETIHQGHGYRLILLPPVMDHLYHSNLGTLIHPKEEGYRLEGQTQLNTPPPLSVEDYGKQALIACWKKLYVSTCPICFESSRCDEGITLPCGHFFCNDCFPMYIQIKATELAGYRENPFLCPAEKCRKELPIHTIVKKFLSGALSIGRTHCVLRGLHSGLSVPELPQSGSIGCTSPSGQNGKASRS